MSLLKLHNNKTRVIYQQGFTQRFGLRLKTELSFIKIKDPPVSRYQPLEVDRTIQESVDAEDSKTDSKKSE